MGELLIPRDKSVVVAADLPLNRLTSLVKATHDVEGISAYKLGFILGLDGLKRSVDRVKRQTEKLPIIFDYQKAGNDIPEMGPEFARKCKEAGVDAVILFPFSSPVTQERWTAAAQDAGLAVLIGGHMTVPKFLESEGGYIADSAPPRIYRLGAQMGVQDFVLPGNKVDYVRKYRQLISEEIGSDDYRVWSPGFITQGGEIADFAEAAGDKWHAIVGSGIYGRDEIRSQRQMNVAARLVTSQIR